MSDALAPIEVFCSYAHEDELYLQELKAHLSGLERQRRISMWYDRQILAGKERTREIDEHLEAAAVILLLISPDFLASDYCYGMEMRRALERHRDGEAQVIPVIVRPVDYEDAPFADLQALPREGKAVTEWENRDAALRDVARDVRAAIKRCSSTSPLPQPVRVPSRALARGTTNTGRGRAADGGPVDRNRERMLKRVYGTWIAGVLDQSLHGAALIALGLEEKADALDNPWRLLMQEVDRPARALPEGTQIVDVYDETDGGLLILGEPGAGKTTMLLELARDLLERAQTNRDEPIPAVFNLSSWAKKRTNLSDWLVEELGIRYEVPRRLGQSWVDEDRLLLLLDGLDEVEAAARRECIGAINSYRQGHPDVQVVVCCRRAEYLNETALLRLGAAVVIQPLTQGQVDGYLENVGEQGKALREAIRDDGDLRELATIPLMLTILLLAYKKMPLDKISELMSLEAKRERIFAIYVEHMLKRRGALKRYKSEQIMHWLSYLARQMKRENQTIFYLEQMQPDWLPKERSRFFYRAIAGGEIGGLLCGMAGAAIFSFIYAVSSLSIYPDTPIPWAAMATGLFIGLLIGQILGSFVGLFRPNTTKIRTAEVITWSWKNARSVAIAVIVGGPLGTLILSHFGYFISDFFNSLYQRVPAYGFFSWLIVIGEILIFLIILIAPEWIGFILIYLFTQRNLDGKKSIISSQKIWYAVRRGALIGILTVCIGITLLGLTARAVGNLVGPLILAGISFDVYLVAVGCVSGLITGAIFGVSHRQLETQTSIKPNQGIWRSLYNGIRILLIVGLIVWLVYDIPFLVSYRLDIARAVPYLPVNFPGNQILTGVLVGLFIGVIFGLVNGGIVWIKHVLLRLFIWKARVLPWNSARFLDYAAERILLRKVGGGYIFVHRLLLEYFASLATPRSGETPVAVISDTPPVLSSTSLSDNILREEDDTSPVSRRKGVANKEKSIVFLLVVLLLLELSCAPRLFGLAQYSVQNAAVGPFTAQAEADATAADALANASPVAYPPINMSPVLDDPLQDNSKGNNWEEGNRGYGNCHFINQTYYIIGSFAWCIAKTSEFTDFVYQVQIKITKGNEGGIIFRVDPTDRYQSDFFTINQDGSYHFWDFRDVFVSGSSPAILRGLNQTNLLAAVVHGKIIELYVNFKRVAVVVSSTSTHGQIGVIAGDRGDRTTGAIFQNAKVWKL